MVRRDPPHGPVRTAHRLAELLVCGVQAHAERVGRVHWSRCATIWGVADGPVTAQARRRFGRRQAVPVYRAGRLWVAEATGRLDAFVLEYQGATHVRELPARRRVPRLRRSPAQARLDRDD